MFRKLRKWFRSLKLKLEASWYASIARIRNISPPNELDLTVTLRNRFPRVAPPQRKGNLSIFSFYHSSNWEEINLGPALNQFGDVIHIDWADQGISNGLAYEAKGWRDAFNDNFFASALLKLSNKKPDVIFTYISHEQIDLSTLIQLRKLGAPIVCLSLNDKEFFVGNYRNGRHGGMRDICRGFDLCWTSTSDALIKYCVEGALPIYLPEGANPLIHKPYPDEKFIYDIGFVGQCYGNRPEVIERLRQVGFDVAAFGPGWPSGPLSHEEMIRTWSRCRINLGFAGVADYKNTFCLKGRDFELPMSGGLYLTEHNDELPAFYEIGKEVLTYRNFDELVEKIRWVLEHPQEAESIRQQGRARALREHSWEMRFQKIFEVLGVL